ncbi:hypothetical protein, partial [Acinetobacter sp. NIOH-H-8]|uniref:hypothetical protein n=1 Tax=Acinetobacter sp. NIOH-H-8 TaxID=3342120 RepID=UPI003987A055
NLPNSLIDLHTSKPKQRHQHHQYNTHLTLPTNFRLYKYHVSLKKNGLGEWRQRGADLAAGDRAVGQQSPRAYGLHASRGALASGHRPLSSDKGH